MNPSKNNFIAKLSEPKTFHYLLWGIIIVGILLRLVLLIQNRPFFIDEAALATEIHKTPYLGFFSSLDYQFAPPIFSMFSKLIVDLFGSLEWAYRFVPFVVGGLSLIMYKQLLLERVGIKAVWFSLAMLAIGWQFVEYSVTAKQYSMDVFCSISLIYLALKYPLQQKVKSIITWSLIGALAVWMSMPAVFILAGVGLYFFISRENKFEKNHVFSLLAVGAAWLLSFFIYYKCILEADLAHSDLQNFHQAYFLPAFPTNAEDWSQVQRILLSIMRIPMGGTAVPLLLGTLLTLWGLVLNFKKDKKSLALFLVPILLCFAASAMKSYSLIPRLNLFFIPILIYWMALAIEKILTYQNKIINSVLTGLLILCLVNQNSLEYFVKEFRVENMPAALNYIAGQSQETKTYVFHHGKPAFIFYQHHYQGKENWPLKNASIGHWADKAHEINAQFSEDQIYLLFSHTDEQTIQEWNAEFSKNRKLIESRKTIDGGVFLFESTSN